MKTHKLGPTECYEKFLVSFNTPFGRRHRKNDGLIAKLQTRMKTFTLDEILEATDTLGKWKFALENKKSNWLQPEYILRNDAQIDRFLNMDPNETVTKFDAGFEEPTKQLAVEIILFAQLKSGLWDEDVKHIYSQELIPWVRGKNMAVDFERTSKLLLKFIDNKDGLKRTAIADQSNLNDCERYVATCKAQNIIPKKEIVDAAEELK